MKTVIKVIDTNEVRIEYDHAWSDERVSRHFWAPRAGGYVLELSTGDSKQVCERLGRHGSTLMCVANTQLADVIRREYRAMRATERRELA